MKSNYCFRFNSFASFVPVLLISVFASLTNSAQAQGYCIPTYGTNCGSGDFINNFSFNTLTKQNSGCNGAANSYTLYASTTTTVEKGGAYMISMQSGPSYAQGFGVWIDYNMDGDFADANEFVYESPIASTSLFSGYISIPTNAGTGLTRLRVRSKYAAKMLNSDQCATLSYGETEDYNITIAQPPACTNPPVAGTAIATANYLCDGTIPFFLSLSGCPNRTGQTYQWQKSPNGTTWSDVNGANTKSISYTLSQSLYFRCVVTCSGSSISTPVFVEAATPFAITYNAVDVSCYGLNNGSVTANVTGGTSPYTYAWSVGGSPFGPPLTYPNAPTIDSVYANSFNVTITDAHGCSATGSYWLNQPGQLYLQKDTASSSCGLPTGAAAVTVFGGTIPYSYLWQSGQTNDTITGLVAGIYSVTVTDGNGCTSSTSVPVSDLGGPILTFTTTAVSCHGGNNGSINVVASGGVPPFSYYWNTVPQQTTTNATGLSAGTYFVTASNLSGCKYVGYTTVFEPGKLYSGASSSPVSCASNCDGYINTYVTGGTWPYTYLWSNGKTDYYVDTLCAGNYTLTITDANLCTLVETHPVLQPVPVSANSAHSNVSCFGLSNGSISLSPTGGKSPYSYNWFPLNFSADTAFNLSAGSYSVIVTDSDTCGDKDTTFVTITQPTAITTTVFSGPANCSGACTGDVDVLVAGGAGSFTYLWMPSGDVTQTASFLCAGVHTVTVTDKNNCSKTDTITVGEPLPVPVTATATPTSCTSKSGSAIASVSGPGAVPPFSYLWTTGSTTNSTTGLDAGVYRANVTDGKGCFGFADAMVTSSNGPAITTTSVTVISCNGLSNGAIDISVTGGSTPYTYFWSNGQTTQDASGLSYGPYEIKVTDATGCESIKSIFVNEPAILAMTYSVINSGCTATNGSAALVVTGGTTPYSYLWSSGGTTPSKSALGAGAYTVTITDSKGCQDIDLIAVQDSGGPIIAVDTIAAAYCGGSGFVLLTPQDSTVISSYLWSTGSTTQNLTNAAPGNYGVVITDINGCKSVLVTRVKPELPPIKPICLVTVDTLTNENIVVWEKPVSSIIAGFNIYRESSMQGIFQKVGYSPYANESTYDDLVADPNAKWARYRITMKDVCGKESPASPDHKTIHLAVQSTTPTSTTLIWDAYVGYPFSYYNIFRKDSSGADWALIAAMPANYTSYTDATFPIVGDTISYHIDVDHGGGDCIATIKNPIPEATTVKSSKSNSSERITISGSAVNELSNEGLIGIFPNPNSGQFMLELKKISPLEIKIFNVLGEEVKKIAVGANKNKIEVDVRNLSAGVYYVRAFTENAVITKKIIIK